MMMFLKILGWKNIIFIIAGTSLFSYFYIQNKKVNNLETSLITANKTIKEQEEIFDKTIKSYEKILAIERTIVQEVATTNEKKNQVIKKRTNLEKEVIKRGEIKIDDKDDFIVVEF